MKTKTSGNKIKRDHLYKLLDSFNEKELKKVSRFAELLNRAKKENDKDLMKLLDNAQYDSEELNEKTIKEVLKAREDFKKGKFHTLEQIKNDLGI